MIRNIFKKIRFVSHIIFRYQNFPRIVLSLLLKQPLTQLDLRNGLSFNGNKESTLLAITDEVFFEAVYTPFPLKIGTGTVVVDIGANIGIFSIFAASRRAKTIIAYEPFPKNVQMLKQNVKQNDVRNVTVVTKAVSGKNGTADLYLGSLDAGNLLFDHNTMGSLSTSVKVKTTTLDSIIRKHQLDIIDFLKIDCEGSEGDILLSTSPRTWARVRQVAIEYHDNVSALSHLEIAKKLQLYGFKTRVKRWDTSDFGYIYAWK